MDAQLSTWSGYRSILEVMNSHPEADFFLAGGAIRDILLKRVGLPKDFDFFLGSGDFAEIISSLKKHGRVIEGPFGSPRWFPDSTEGDYADVISISAFFNGLSYCSSITDVLNQFDFTGNAIALNLRNGRVHDPQDGIRDLCDRVLRMVRFDYPDEPIRPGHPLNRTTVLWFRILHYAALLNLDIEPVTLRWLNDHIKYRIEVDVVTRYLFKPNDFYLKPLKEMEV